MSDMQEYVAGFLFDGSIVWLIRKKKPDWQKGKLNGIGGKIEPGELPFDAMVREFKEEAGLQIKSWKHYCTITDEKNWKVYFYYAHSDEKPKTMTDEEVVWYDYEYLPSDVLPNLNWLIPMALSFNKGEITNNFYVKYE